MEHLWKSSWPSSRREGLALPLWAALPLWTVLPLWAALSLWVVLPLEGERRGCQGGILGVPKASPMPSGVALVSMFDAGIGSLSSRGGWWQMQHLILDQVGQPMEEGLEVPSHRLQAAQDGAP